MSHVAQHESHGSCTHASSTRAVHASTYLLSAWPARALSRPAAVDSVARHHDVIEIQSGSESEEEADVKPDPEPPAKRQRAAPAGRVKRERP